MTRPQPLSRLSRPVVHGVSTSAVASECAVKGHGICRRPIQGRGVLNGHLLQYSREKGSQIAVLTVPAISPETPFDYSARVMEEWKLGRKDVSDGVLLLLVRDERKTHLAVGRGLEGAIPDVYAKRILQDVLSPYLREGKTGEGVAAAVAQIEKLIAGEKLPEASTQSDAADDRMGNLLVLLVVLFFIGAFLKMCFGPSIGSLLTGSSAFGAALMLGLGVQAGLVAGLIMEELQSIPDVGDFADFHGWRFQVVEKDGQRIERVKIIRLPEEG